MIDLPEFKSYAEELKYLVTNPDRLQYIAQLVKGLSETGNTLVLVNRIDSGKQLIELIDGAVFISGEVKGTKRAEEYKEHATNDNKVTVATFGVAAVGINIPRIFNLVLLEPGKSFVRVIQSIGRGIRKAEDKDFVQIWDLTSTCKFAKRHLTTRKKFYKDAKYPFTITKTDWQK
jgi:superfamily II DNA or RNA helicase